MAMKLTITTQVWHGEYDPSEFIVGHELIKSEDYYYTVIETFEFDPQQTSIKIEPA